MTIVLSPHSVKPEDAPKQLLTMRFLSDLNYQAHRDGRAVAICRVWCIDDTSYEHMIRSLWSCTDDIIIIEHDIVPSIAQYYEIMDCPHQFCAGVYYLFYEGWKEPVYSASYWIGSEIHQVKEGDEYCQWPSLGFVKFGAPRPKLTLDDGYIDGRDHSWNNLDGALQGTFLDNLWVEAGRPNRDEFKPWHLHWPIVTHNTPLLQKFERIRMPLWPKDTTSK